MERVELPQGPQEKVLEIFLLLKTKKVMLTDHDQVCSGVPGGARGGGQLELFDQPGDLDYRWTHRLMFSRMNPPAFFCSAQN